jgi:hypothetical protein
MNAHEVITRRLKQGFVVFAAIAAVLLLAEHRTHVLPYLPWLLLAACPLMHLFMHHGGHGERVKHPSPRRTPEDGNHE